MEVAEGQPVGHQLCRVRLHVILLDIATDGINPGDAFQTLELRANDPVLHRPQVRFLLQSSGESLAFGSQVGAVTLPAWHAIADGDVLRRCVGHRPGIDFAEPRGDGAHTRFSARGQTLPRLHEPFVHLLPGEVDVHVVAKHRRDL